MKLRTLALVLLAAFWAAAGANAAGSPRYDDPGMSYQAPAGWQRVDLPQTESAPDERRPPAAAFSKDFGKGDRRAIVVDIQPYDGGLERLANDKDEELRRGSDDTRITAHERTALADGMPAYWLCADQGSELGSLVRRCEYVVFDGQRSIVVTYVGRQGYFDEKEARSALASLYVVLYPAGR
ncbi:MAG: hypothetical protein WAJ85_14400 [Candidatus Baltobacteraceae bacterium]|jgi:hypothetical protein